MITVFTRANVLTASPGATTSGLMRRSWVKPYELNIDTMSTSAKPLVSLILVRAALVTVKCASPNDVDPTERTFLPIAGEVIVQTERLFSPPLPAANISRFSGF